jgi:hypothetical protein
VRDHSRPASAQVSTTGTGPYYATPSWDQKITTGRFVVLGNWNNEAVLDRETGLVWEKEAGTGKIDLQFASLHCLALTKGGRMGWRLPTVPELTSLVDPSQSNPALPSGHPFNRVVFRLLDYDFTDVGSQFCIYRCAAEYGPAWCEQERFRCKHFLCAWKFRNRYSVTNPCDRFIVLSN